MKNLITYILLMGVITISCSAQQKIAVLENNKIVQTDLIKYKIINSAKTAVIENRNNILTNINRSSPNLPANINLHYNKK